MDSRHIASAYLIPLYNNRKIRLAQKAIATCFSIYIEKSSHTKALTFISISIDIMDE